MLVQFVAQCHEVGKEILVHIISVRFWKLEHLEIVEEGNIRLALLSGQNDGQVSSFLDMAEIGKVHFTSNADSFH